MLLGIAGGWAVGLRLPGSTDVNCTATNPLPMSITVFGAVLVRNLLVYLLLIGGVITFGLMSAGVLVTNGIYLGLALGALSARACLGVGLLVTVPHGLFELPALVLGGAIGLRGVTTFRRFEREKPRVPSVLCGSVGRITLGGLVLLVVAAAVEATISRHLLAGRVSWL